MMNRQLVLTRVGGPEALAIRVVAHIPEPGPGEVLVRVEASSLVFTDTLIRRDLYPVLDVEPPLVMGYDLVGRVEAVGAGVAGWAPGDRVADLTQTGGAQDFALRPAGGLVRAPEGVDAAEAETMVLSGMTAYQSLARLGGLRPGASVLVLGASGAVGVAALDVARALGARTVGVASERRRDVLAGRADVVLSYGAEGADVGLRAAARAEGGFDIVLDVAGAWPVSALAGLLAEGGRIVLAGFASMRTQAAAAGDPATFKAMLRTQIGALLAAQEAPGARFTFYDIAMLRVAQPDWFREDLATLFRMLDQGRMSPVAEVVSLNGAAEAHARLDRGDVVGRLVLVLDRS